MNGPLISEVISAINDFAPLRLQESWDNSGVQVGGTDHACTGVMICVDVNPAIIAEARRRACNLVIAHHPLLFRGLKRISPGDNVVQQTVIDAIRADITIFSSHTALDSATKGISYRMAKMLGASPISPLITGGEPSTGLGSIAQFNTPISKSEFISLVKTAFNSPVVRCSAGTSEDFKIFRLGICGGAGGEFIENAIQEGCDAYLTSDVRYHDFADYGKRIFIADIGHFESEECSKEIFYEIISEKFPNFAVYKSENERNPIKYL